jgi:hypothetical protein
MTVYKLDVVIEKLERAIHYCPICGEPFKYCESSYEQVEPSTYSCSKDAKHYVLDRSRHALSLASKQDVIRKLKDLIREEEQNEEKN